MKGMHELGIINDAKMCEFDKMCLSQESETDYNATPDKTEFISSVTV